MRRFLTTTAILSALLLVATIAAGCSSDDGDGDAPPAAAADTGESGAAAAGGDTLKELDLSITFTSSVFNETKRIPRKHTCTKQSNNDPNISPPLAWEGVPEGTKSMALVMDSFEAVGDGPRVHWVLWNLPPDVRELAEGVPNTELLDNGARQGTNDSGTIGYLGPCPPPIVPIAFETAGGGDVLHQKQKQVKDYFFRVYALDAEIDLAPGATKDDLLVAIDGRILGAGELVGERQGKLILKE